MKTRTICRIVCAALALLLSAPVARADYLGSWSIDDYIDIKANTHRLSSGAAYSATSITYSVYEDAATPTKLSTVGDVAMDEVGGVTGFYLKRLQLTAANGFEAGKHYTVLVQATVDGVVGTKSDSFQIGLNVGALDSNSLPTSAANVFDDLVTATGAGTTLNLDAYGNVTLSDASLTGAKYGTGAVAQTVDVNAVLGTPAGASVSVDIAALKTDTAAILADTGTDGVVVASGSKTGYKLASDGLDSVSTAAPSGVPTDFREMMVMVYRRFFKKVTMTSTVLSTYADDGSTVLTEQDLSDPGSLRTTGAAQAP
jgi:hypothetical protein